MASRGEVSRLSSRSRRRCRRRFVGLYKSSRCTKFLGPLTPDGRSLTFWDLIGMRTFKLN